MTHVQARTRDGVTLALRRFPAEGPRRGVVLVTHAMMASGSYLGRFAGALAAAGLDTFVLDFRGHGGSVPPGVEDGWTFDDLVEQDLPAAWEAVARETGVPVGEIGYVGHSLGGLVGVAAVGTGRVPQPRRLVLVAVGPWDRPTPLRLLIGAAFLASARLAGRVPARALRLGSEDEAAGYARQFADWVLSGWRSQRGTSYLVEARHVRSPVLAVVSSRDWMCRPADATELLAALPGPARLRVVGRDRDDAVTPDHFELLTSAGLAPVWAEVATFLAS
jgi:predicted alpha/beta hydrolase